MKFGSAFKISVDMHEGRPRSFLDLPGYERYRNRGDSRILSRRERGLKNSPKFEGIGKGGRRIFLTSFEDIKEQLDRNPSLKHKDGFFYNDSVIYKCDNSKDLNAARDYYFNLENRIQKIDNEDFIKDLVWNKHARHDLADGRLLYNGIVYDGGEIAKQEAFKKLEEEKNQIHKQHRKKVFETHNKILKEKAKEILNNQKAKITNEAKEKAHRIAERMVKLSGGNYEIYMGGSNFLNKREDMVIRDIYIPHDQNVSSTRCSSSPSGYRSTQNELSSKNQKSVAWIHSHANMSPFHSSIDDVNLKTETGIRGEKITLEILAEGYKSKNVICVCPSFVFNSKREDPYIQMGVSYNLHKPPRESLKEKRYQYITKKNAPLEVINEYNGIDMNVLSIDREISEKVNWPGKNSSNLEQKLENQETQKKTEELLNKYAARETKTSEEQKRPVGKFASYLSKGYNSLMRKYNKLAKDFEGGISSLKKREQKE